MAIFYGIPAVFIALLLLFSALAPHAVPDKERQAGKEEMLRCPNV